MVYIIDLIDIHSATISPGTANQIQSQTVGDFSYHCQIPKHLEGGGAVAHVAIGGQCCAAKSRTGL